MVSEQQDIVGGFEQSFAEGLVTACTATMWVWNGIISISHDVEAFSGRRLKLYDYAFFLSRFLTGGLLLLSIRFLTVTTDAGCKQVLTTVTWFEASALISNSSLFLFRVLAVFADSLMAKTAFICLWLTTFLSLTIPFSMTINFAPLACNIRKVQLVGSAGFFAVAVFDTLVFIAISFRLYAINWCALRKRRLTPISFFCGKGLGRASNALLRTGQVYYITTVGSHVFVLVTILSPHESFSPTFRAGFTLVSVAMQNIMACEVFRLLRLQVVQDELSSMRFPSIRIDHTSNNSTTSSTNPTIRSIMDII